MQTVKTKWCQRIDAAVIGRRELVLVQTYLTPKELYCALLSYQ